MERRAAWGDRRARRPVDLRTLALVALLAVPLSLSAVLVVPVRHVGPAPSEITTEASNTSVTLAISGITPGAVGLSWTPSSDLLFTHYEVYQSSGSSSGPWTDLGAVGSQSSTTYFVGGLSPGGAYWWRVTVTDSLLGTTSSNVVHASTPGVPSLAAAQLSASTVSASWTNPGTYSTIVAFGSYTLLSVGPGGATSVVATTNSPSVQEYTVESVQNNTTYTFEVRTADVCGNAANCGAATLPAQTTSHTGTVSTTATLRSAVNAHRTTVPAGTNDSFACSAQGGKHPYAFSWAFGDGTTATGPFATHTYANSGTYVVTCTVADAFRSTTRATNSVTVTGTSTSGGGGGSGGSGTGGGNGSLSGGGSGGSPGRSLPLGSLLGPVAAVVLVTAFVLAVLVLAMLSRRRRRDAHPPTGAGVVLNGDLPPADAPGEVGEPSAAPGPSTEAPPMDLDRLMDELENASTDSG